MTVFLRPSVDQLIPNSITTGMVRQPLQHRFQSDHPFSSGGSILLKSDPPFVESVEHLHARSGILHALGFEKFLPRQARNSLRPNRTAENLGERRRNLIGSHTRRSFELDDLAANP